MLTSFLLTLAVTAMSSVAQDLSPRSNSCTLGSHVNKVDLLNLHNQARKLMGVNILHWDDSLACFAQGWADRCVFEHSHREGYGENIAAGYGNNYSPATGVKDWYKEIYHYRLSMGYTDATGHVTQMGWKDTKKVGCGVGVCSASSLGLSTGNEQSLFVVCSYDPPGNYIGDFKGEVHLPSSNRMIGLKYNATHNDRNPALFGKTTASVAKSRLAAVAHIASTQQEQADDEDDDEEQTSTQQTSVEPVHNHKNEQTVYTGNDGFVTTSWQALQKWIKDKCAQGQSWKYTWKSTWDNKKRSISNEAETIATSEVDVDGVINSRKSSKFAIKRTSLHRRLLRKRSSAMKL